MPCCCDRVLNLCNVNVCGTLEIEQSATAAESGAANVYTLVLDYLNTTASIVAEQTEGENIAFDVSSLNENYQYTGKIYDSAGNQVSIISDGETYDCIKFKTIIGLNSVTGTAIPPVLDIPDTVVIEDVIGEDPVITGTTETVTGLTDGNNTITCAAFIGVRVIVIRGNIPIPGIDPGDGSKYFTKNIADDFITLSDPLVQGEFIRIQTIPN